MPRKRRLASIRIHGSGILAERDAVVHSESVPGQSVRTLCGFEGGGVSGVTDDPIQCADCLAILRYFRFKVPE